jgi:hypothetical protein
MNQKKILVLFVSLTFFLTEAQVKNGIGINLNLGTAKRLNFSLCYEHKLADNIFLRVNAGYGNLIPFNTIDNTERLFLMRKNLEPANHAKHLDLIYKGYNFYQQESKVTAPEIKLGAIMMLKKFQSNYRQLSGLYAGYQTSFSVISQSYKNYYRSDSLRKEEIVEGINRYYSWSLLSLTFGWKILITPNTTFDLSIDQTLGIIFDSEFKRISDFYRNPYSGLQVDLSIGIRQIF